jgi:hypothetical protein
VEVNPFGPLQLQLVAVPVTFPRRFNELPIQIGFVAAFAEIFDKADTTAILTVAETFPQLFDAVTE